MQPEEKSKVHSVTLFYGNPISACAHGTDGVRMSQNRALMSGSNVVATNVDSLTRIKGYSHQAVTYAESESFSSLAR